MFNARAKWEHCTLTGKKVHFMGADKLMENKGDSYANEASAWDDLEKNGWELTAVVIGKGGELIHYFKRRTEE